MPDSCPPTGTEEHQNAIPRYHHLIRNRERQHKQQLPLPAPTEVMLRLVFTGKSRGILLYPKRLLWRTKVDKQNVGPGLEYQEAGTALQAGLDRVRSVTVGRIFAQNHR